MPIAPESQIPKPLTYALMFHLVWVLVFGLSGAGLMALFLTAGQPLKAALVPPLALLALAGLSLVMLLVVFAARVQVVMGEMDRASAFDWSRGSSLAVASLGPLFWLATRYLGAPLAGWLLNGGSQTTVPATAALAGALTQVELIVWWLSHLLSLMMLRGARRRYVQRLEIGD